MPLTASVGSEVPPFGTTVHDVSVDPYPRTLAFASNYNFRDVGGYAAGEGRTVRWRRLFRADSLHRLAGDDLAAFTARGSGP